jgi:hypothetical protein
MELGNNGGAHGVLYIGLGNVIMGREGRVVAVGGFHYRQFQCQ